MDIIDDYIKEKNIDKNIVLNISQILRNTTNIKANPVVDNLFYRENITGFSGDISTGKSWLMLDLSLKLADGKAIWEIFPSKPKKILMFQGSLSAGLLKERLRSHLLCKNIDNFNIITIEGFEKENLNYFLNKKEGKKAIEHFINLIKPDLIIIDPLEYFLEEINIKNFKTSLQFLKKIAVEYKNHIIFITSENNRENSYICNPSARKFISSLFRVYPQKEDNKWNIINTINLFKKINNFKYAIKDRDDEAIEIKYYHEKITSNDMVKSSLLKTLKGYQYGLTEKQIIKETGINKKIIEITLNELIAEKEIKIKEENNKKRYLLKRQTLIKEEKISSVPPPERIKPEEKTPKVKKDMAKENRINYLSEEDWVNYDIPYWNIERLIEFITSDKIKKLKPLISYYVYHINIENLKDTFTRDKIKALQKLDGKFSCIDVDFKELLRDEDFSEKDIELFYQNKGMKPHKKYKKKELIDKLTELGFTKKDIENIFQIAVRWEATTMPSKEKAAVCLEMIEKDEHNFVIDEEIKNLNKYSESPESIKNKEKAKFLLGIKNPEKKYPFFDDKVATAFNKLVGPGIFKVVSNNPISEIIEEVEHKSEEIELEIELEE